jgi:hypothetical protein
MSALLLTWTLIGTGAGFRGGSASVSAQTPDPCALLMTSEIEDSFRGPALRFWQKPFVQSTTNLTVANGVASPNDAIGVAKCQYAWGAGTGHFTLDVVVSDPARGYARMTPDMVKQQLQSMVKTGTADEALTDVGDVAVFTSDSYHLATTTALVKGRILRVQLDGYDARDKKDGVIRLLKSAASRLQ